MKKTQTKSTKNLNTKIDSSHKKTVFVGLSGGVDSSVSAYLLKKQGYNVVGVYMKTWQPEFVECTWNEEKRDAMRVATHLDIPFVFLDVSAEYESMVAKKMINEYKLGKTPNPDVLCNRDIKFGIFLKHAIRHGADFIATGHYAKNSPKKIEKNKEVHILSRGKDSAKDQSYFLWMLSETELAKTIFPIGDLNKTEVRKLASKIGLSTAEKKDSQGICFIGNINMKDFLMNYIEPSIGNVLNTEGKIIGKHDGSAFYTIGERHGFVVDDHKPDSEPYYVISKNMEKNTITVSHDNPFHQQNIISSKNNKFYITDTNFRLYINPKKVYTVESRYHGKKGTALIRQMTGNTAEIVLISNPGPVVAGQSLVIYDKNICIGGGIIA